MINRINTRISTVIGFVAAVGLAAAVGGSVVAWGQGAPPATEGAPAAGGGPAVTEFKPSMSDLMNMLVQPRHIKLYYAGKSQNWTLAAFEVGELKNALARVGRTIPVYRKMSVDTAVTSIIADKIKALDAAIKAKDEAQFMTAYGETTQACNACHQGLDHPFVKIKVPAEDFYPDQEFAP
ncbi:MAG TPA: cytochrome family protein [Xanthobacteraceae bacterium]|jgi:hypothetical protein|nr:cytochrome family protein [Xanthobacteraceae bacterium]